MPLSLVPLPKGPMGRPEVGCTVPRSTARNSEFQTSVPTLQINQRVTQTQGKGLTEGLTQSSRVLAGPTEEWAKACSAQKAGAQGGYFIDGAVWSLTQLLFGWPARF